MRVKLRECAIENHSKPITVERNRKYLYNSSISKYGKQVPYHRA